MTIQSACKRVPRREKFGKAVRAKAHKEGVVYRTALNTIDSRPHGITKESCPCCVSFGGVRVRNHSIHPVQLAEDTLPIRYEDVYDFKVDFDSSPEANFRRHTDLTVSLLDIARPAKGKGVAKDFEVVSKVRHVLTLPEDEFEVWEDDVFERSLWDDDWEKIDNEHRVDTRQSYSSVLRGNDR